MKRLLLITIFFLAVIATQAQPKVKSYSVKFKIKNFGLTVDGRLKGLVYYINFKPDNLAKSEIRASVKVSTINTGISARDSHLKKDDYFDAKKYPTISIESTKFTKVEGNQYSGTFKLTIKNVTKEITFPFTYSNNTFSGTFTINRRDFGVGGSSFSMGDNVTVNLTVTMDE